MRRWRGGIKKTEQSSKMKKAKEKKINMTKDKNETKKKERSTKLEISVFELKLSPTDTNILPASPP